MRTQRRLSLIAALPILLCAFFCQQRAFGASGSVVNPLLPSGPDPWVEYKDGFYYFMPDWVWIAVFVVAYVLLTRWILPRLGVPT